MARLAFYLFFITAGISLHSENKFHRPEKPKICLNMIVKNESKVIERCLASVKPLIDYWVIFDTGSTDNTQEIIKNFMKDIPGELHESPWVDFEHNRNEALRQAKDKGDYIFFIDADEELAFDEGFIMPKLDRDAYFVISRTPGGGESGRILFIKNSLNWKWEGVLHEVITCDGINSAPILLGVINKYSYEGVRSQNPNKYLDDAKVFEAALLKEPEKSRYRFYLAKSYDDAQDYANALTNYEKRLGMGGFQEEIFWSLFRIGVCQQVLKMEPEKIIESYNRAFNFRPTRKEPLYYLTQYYLLSNESELAYETVKKALAAPPHHDILFLEQWMYEYGLLFQLSDCAYRLKKFEEAATACEEALKAKHLPPHLKTIISNNLTIIKTNIQKPTICLNMIVKNESKIIEKCLASVKPLINHWVIVDTGSTDKTQEVIKNFMKDIPGELHERAWVNFAHNRNEALELARSKADYCLFIDADDILILPEFFQMPPLVEDLYAIQIHMSTDPSKSNLVSTRGFLMKTSLDTKWTGILHEVLDTEKQYLLLDGPFLLTDSASGHRSQDPDKYLKDAQTLIQALKDEPDNVRYQLFLGISYKLANQLELALEAFTKCAGMKGCGGDELYLSFFEMGNIQETLGQSPSIFLKNYEKAFQHYSNRAEPLFFLGNYYVGVQNYEKAYDLFKQASHLPIPPNHSLVIQKIYSWAALHNLSICSERLGKIEETKQYLEQLLISSDLPLEQRRETQERLSILKQAS